MTHGEVWFEKTREDKLDLTKEFQCSPRNLPEQMSRDDAAKYYNTKLFNYWFKTIKFTHIKSVEKRAMAIKHLMFGNPLKTKLLEENLACGA